MQTLRYFFIFFIFTTVLYSQDNLTNIKLQLKWKHQFKSAGFIAAVEIDHVHWEVNRLSNANLSGRDYIQSQPLLLQDKCHGLIDKGFAGVDDRSISITLAKFGFELSTFTAQVKFIKEV